MDRGRILVIEPEPHARLALRELLVDEGYEVLAVSDAADIKAMAEFAPHVALVDATQMAEPSARSLASIAPVSILMSLRDPPSTAVDFLRKPIDIGRLFASVASAVERAFQLRSSPGGASTT